MQTEKIYMAGYVTRELFEDSTAGPEFITSMFRRSLIKSAEEKGYVVILPPRVHFQKIDALSLNQMDAEMAERGLMKVVAIRRAAKIIKIDEVGTLLCPCGKAGAIFLCVGTYLSDDLEMRGALGGYCSDEHAAAGSAAEHPVPEFQKECQHCRETYEEFHMCRDAQEGSEQSLF